jgi:hypothetical protein
MRWVTEDHARIESSEPPRSTLATASAARRVLDKGWKNVVGAGRLMMGGKEERLTRSPAVVMWPATLRFFDT